LVHGDRQWRPIKEHLQSLLVGAVPQGEPTPRYLHTADIYHGWGEFPRDRWPEPVRHELLDEIAKVPLRFRVPVVWGVVNRPHHAGLNPTDTRLQQLIDCYSIATTTCLFQLEWYMRNRTLRQELASVTLEHNGDLQKRIKEVYRAMSSPKILDEVNEEHHNVSRQLLPFSKIIDEPAFQEKTLASILQLADFCAWALKRASDRQRDHERFAKPFAPATLRWSRNPKVEGLLIGPAWGAS
jgi:hypothetical protein